MRPGSLLLCREERIGASLLAAVTLTLLVAGLIIEAAGPGAFAVEFTGDAGDGTLVVHTGTLEDIRKTETGGHLVLVVGGVRVFVPASAVPTDLPEKGESVRVTGTVQTYQGEKEIVVRNSGDIVRSP